ncbi:MAG: 16S rRNA (guanine(966)-N(2))-methyltransferase RsmD [bacterium]
MVRIVGGAASGRRLSVADRGTRPTSERVREALFSALGSALGSWDGVSVLDLYCGSGALGLEALSRGAASVTLVERDRAVARILRENVAQGGLPGAHVVVSDVHRLLTSAPPAGSPFDVAFLAPPYDVPDAQVTALLGRLRGPGWLRGEAIAVVERPVRTSPGVGESPWPEGWVPLRRRDYGDTALWYGRVATGEKA